MKQSPSLPPTREILRVCATVAAAAAALWLAWELRGVIKLVALAVFVAVALGPPVELAARRLPRPAAVGVVYATIAAVAGGLLYVSVPALVDQLTRLSDNLPTHLDELRSSDLVQRLGLDETLGTSDLWQDRVGDLAGTVQSLTVTVGSLALQTAAVAAMAFLLLLEAPRLTASAGRLLDVERHRRAARVAAAIYRSVGGYVAGMAILSLLAGALTFATLRVTGVPFALPLAVLTAFLNLVPLLGATIAALAVAAVCLAFEPQAAVWWLAVVVVYQQIENALLAPLIYRRTVKVHPLIVIMSLLAGGALMGVLGALLAIPAAACAQIMLRDWWEHRRRPLKLGGVLELTPRGHDSTGDGP